MGDDEPFGWDAPLERTVAHARDAVTVARLLARRPPMCPLVRAALERVLLKTLRAWSCGRQRTVRPGAPTRRMLELVLQTAHVLQPRKGESR